MSSPVNAFALNPGAEFYYTEKWQHVIEDHRDHLFRLATAETPLEITPHLAYKYQYDFYGLLNNLGVSLYMHWVVLRINDFTAPTEFDHNRTVLYVPPESEIERLRQIAVTTYN